ncbi:hypothetical protein GE09DRAFT_495448 [Coniochaeta sp. 2T2.1]|nr:hypothetical protein GE09DRAFT_495448 [Coniochaeta sp. 2T2.1]
MMKTAVLLSSLWASFCLANDPLTPDKVEADLKTNELQRNLWNLNKIARDNGGNRAFGTPGYKASVDFVLERAQKRFAKEMDTYVQPFTHTFEQTRQIWVKGPAGENVYVITLLYNHATPVPGGITAELIDTRVDDGERGSACFEDQWAGIDATGKIALIKRGVCAIADKLKLAKAHGAVAAIVYNQTPGTAYGSATLSADNIGLLVPAGLIPLEVGTAWKARLAAGEKLSASLLVDSVFEERETWNVVSETKEGSPDSVIMLGAHLDSVQAGPGINDDGSGTTALLEIMGSIKKYKGFPHKVRFAWWGAEESGLVGSLYYTSHLNETEADAIKYYFNYDMIGSIAPYYHVYKSENSGIGAETLVNWISSQGKPAEYGSFGTSSDYVGFLELGIPSSGIFTGAGAPEDPCYHLACDTLDNIDYDALTVNAKAAGRAAAKLALSLDGVPARTKVTRNVRARNAVVEEFKKWASVGQVAEHSHNCAHKASNVD